MSAGPCHVYLLAEQVQAREQFFKVGISASPVFRYSAIATACPFPLRLAYRWRLPNRAVARLIEKRAHHDLGYCRRNGEWFFESVIGSAMHVERLIGEYFLDDMHGEFGSLIAWMVAANIDAEDARLAVGANGWAA